MNDSHLTAPFGRRTLTLAMVASQANARFCPEDSAVHKWKTFRAIKDAKDRLNVSDRSLTVLNALLTCHPDTVLTPGKDLIVFPSNMSLSERTHGMADTTLRRHLFALVSAGLIIRRDSPNGKRYARRAGDGSVDQAFGFDLTPILARAQEFEHLSEEVRRERRLTSLARERVTILRRDITKMIAVAIEEEAPGDWARLQREFALLSGRLPRSITVRLLEPLAKRLEELAIEVVKLLEMHISTQNMTGNDGHSGAHYQNSNTEPLIESEPDLQKEGKVATEMRDAVTEHNAKPRPAGFPLGMIIKACPDIAMYTRSGISDWGDLVTAAGIVRSALGVSPSAWEDAKTAMGDIDAAITIAAILQRSEEIKSPGGYLRGLTAKAATGGYSTGPIVMALWRKQAICSKSRDVG